MNKKILFASALLVFIFNSCKKEEPEIITISTEHKSLLIDFTATWCCPCGGALDIFKDVQSKYPYKLVPMGIHASSGDPFYKASVYNYWANVYNVSGIPHFVGDNRDVSWGYVAPDFHLDTSDFYTIIKADLAEAPVCGIGMKKTFSGNTLTVKTKTAFFQGATGKFVLGLYLLEDGLVYTQNCNTDNVHNHVVRDCINDPIYALGTVIVNNATVNKGHVVDKEFTYTVPASYVQANLHIVAVVYSMGTGPKPLAILNVNEI